MSLSAWPRAATFIAATLGAIIAQPSAVRAFENQAPPINYTTYSDEQLADALREQMESDGKDWCGILVPLTRQMVTRGSFVSEIADISYHSQMICALTENRWQDAYLAMIALERRSGEQVEFPLSVSIARLAERFDVADARLLAYLDDDRTAMLDADDVDVVWDLAQAHYEAKQRERSLALFRALWQPERIGKIPADKRDALGTRLFTLEAEVGDADAAVPLLRYLDSAHSVQQALADRRYAALWPRIEAMAGRNMAIVIDKGIDSARTKFDADPDNPERLNKLAHAYLEAGRFDDAVALVSAREPSVDAYDTLVEDMGWALNVKAYALDALGRPDEAEAIFERIAALDPDDGERGWLVSFVINRAIRLVDLGQAERGLAAAHRAGEVSETWGSDFARMLVRRTKICALDALGRTDEIGPLLEEVIEHAEKAQSVAAEAMLCARADDRAAEVVRDALNDPARVGAMLVALQSPDFRLFYNDSVRPHLSQKIRVRPDIAPLFERLGRDIPRDFAPPFATRRAALRAAGE